MTVFAFYLFAVVACISGFMVVLSKNPVHSVLWLILTFLCAAGLFVLQGAEFVAMLLIIVYVGAVAVLFLFVVMMLDIDFAELKGELARFLPLGLVIAAVLLTVLGMSFAGWITADGAADHLHDLHALEPGFMGRSGDRGHRAEPQHGIVRGFGCGGAGDAEDPARLAGLISDALRCELQCQPFAVAFDLDHRLAAALAQLLH